MSPPARSGPDERTPLTREAVIEAALELFAQAQDVSVRDVAARLGVSPMALYRHVESKEDLVDEVVDRQLAETWRPDVEPDRWRDWTIEAADRLRRFLLERPAALQLYLRRPVRSSTAMLRMAACLDVLRTGLGDEDRAHSAFAAVQTYTVGFAALEASRERNPVPIDSDEDPVLLELAAYVSPAQFRAGLGYLLDGVLGFT